VLADILTSQSRRPMDRPHPGAFVPAIEQPSCAGANEKTARAITPWGSAVGCWI
jgi:hypothetical protein